MDYFVNLDIKDKFSSKEDYLSFIEWLNILLEDYTLRYNYLGVKKENWIKLFENLIMQLYKNESTIKESLLLDGIKKTIYNFIFNSIKNNDIRIINNLLMKILLQTNNCRKTLNCFVRELKELDFDISDIINEEYYLMLKEKSPILQKIIKTLHIYELNYIEFISFLLGEYDYIYNLKPYNKTLKWTISTLEKVISYIEGNKLVLKSLQVTTSKESAKIKYILSNYECIEEIKELVLLNYPSIETNAIYKVIFNFNLEQITKLVADYRYYLIMESEQLKNKDFLIELASIIYNITDIKIKSISLVAKTKNEIITSNTQTLVKKSKKFKTLYDYFVNDEISLEKKKRVVDEIFDKLPEYQKRLVNNFINDNLTTNEDIYKAKNVIYKLRKHFANYFVTIKRKKKFTTIYEFFHKEYKLDNMSEVIDMLFYNLPIDQQNHINNYLAGKYKIDTFNYRKACNLINKLRIHYRGYVNELMRHYDQLCNSELLQELLEILQIDNLNINNINYERIPFYIAKLKLIEIKFRENWFTKEEYDEYISKKIKEIIYNYNNLEELINAYINIASIDLELMKEDKHKL